MAEKTVATPEVQKPEYDGEYASSGALTWHRRLISTRRGMGW